MTTANLPFCIIASDGVTIRTIHPPALGAHRATVEAALAAVLKGAQVAHPLEVEAKAQVAASRPATADMLTQGEIARVQGFTGDSCPECGNFAMKRNGSCLSCTACGATTGCS